MATTIIDQYTDPSLPGANVYSATAGNVIVTYNTDKAIYVTEVTENVNQQFITNINNVLTGDDYEVQFPTTDGNGNLSWTTVSGTGTVTSVGVTSNSLTVTGSPVTSSGVITIDMPSNITANSVRANSFIQGNATTTISTQSWFAATTFGAASNQLLYTTATGNVASIDFHVTATDGTTSRQVSKLLVTTLGTTTNYTEYGTIFVGGLVADFEVNQTAGNINLTVSPTLLLQI
jgi:hypothetical protein